MGEKKLTVNFVLCEKCEKHGMLVFSDGREGGEFCSKYDASLMLYCANLVGSFRDVENESFKAAKTAIENSTLPERIDEFNFLKKVVNTWNTAKLHQPNLKTTDSFHTTMDSLWHYRMGDD